LGGLLLIDKGDGGVIYSFQEKRFGDHAPKEEILDACKTLYEKAKSSAT